MQYRAGSRRRDRRPAQRRRHVAGDEGRARIEAKTLEHCRARPPARRISVGADAERIRQLGQKREQDRAAADAEIGDAKRRVRAPPRVDGGERGLDHRLGFRPRHQRRRHDAQSARLQNSLVPMMRATGSRASRRAPSAAIAQASSRVEVAARPPRARPAWSSPSAWPTIMRASRSGRIDAALARNSAAQIVAPDIADRYRTAAATLTPRSPAPSAQSPRRRAVLAWCSATSASMISPSASPSIICGSL